MTAVLAQENRKYIMTDWKSLTFYKINNINNCRFRRLPPQFSVSSLKTLMPKITALQ